MPRPLTPPPPPYSKRYNRFTMRELGAIVKKATMSADGTAKSKGLGLTPSIFSKQQQQMQLKVTVSDDPLFLYPGSGGGSINYDLDPNAAPERDQEEQTLPAILVVSIALTIPEGVQPPEKINALTVELRGNETLGFPKGAFEQQLSMQISKKVESATNMALSSGKVYTWEVPLEVQHDTPPYERCTYGRVYQRIRVKFDWDSWGSWLKGGGGRSLVAEKDAFIVCIPRTSNILDYARTHRSAAEHLGPIIMHARSQHLTVGGYLRLAVSLPSLSPDMRLIRIGFSLIETTTLHSRKRLGYTEQCSPDRVEFFCVEGDELKNSLQTSDQAVKTFEGAWIARLPGDDKIRPSTLGGSRSAIRLTHVLEAKIIFAPEKGAKPLVYSASWPLILPSCCCMWRSLRLPTYSEMDPMPVPDKARDFWDQNKWGNIHSSQDVCACGQPLEKLLSWEDEGDDEANTCQTRLMQEEMALAAEISAAERRRPSMSAAAAAAAASTSAAAIEGERVRRRLRGRDGSGTVGGIGPVDRRTIMRSASRTSSPASMERRSRSLEREMEATGETPSAAEEETQEQRDNRRLMEQKATQQYVSVDDY